MRERLAGEEGVTLAEHSYTTNSRNALLLAVGHSGPEEGSEHYFGYATEAHTARSFVHGELIGLGTVLMSGLQHNEQERAAAFLDRCGVEWRPNQLGLERATLEAVLLDLPRFVRRKGLPHLRRKRSTRPAESTMRRSPVKNGWH